MVFCCFAIHKMTCHALNKEFFASVSPFTSSQKKLGENIQCYWSRWVKKKNQWNINSELFFITEVIIERQLFEFRIISTGFDSCFDFWMFHLKIPNHEHNQAEITQHLKSCRSTIPPLYTNHLGFPPHSLTLSQVVSKRSLLPSQQLQQRCWYHETSEMCKNYGKIWLAKTLTEIWFDIHKSILSKYH